MEGLPFIKKFKIGSHCYIYDVNSNALFRVDEPVYVLVDGNQRQRDMDEEARRHIDSMKEKGYFSGHRPGITYFHAMSRNQFSNELREILDHKLQKITLVVTENCNLRCRYCAYSGKYLYNRKHSSRNMASDTMKRAVDFYLTHSGANAEKNISFYGGEPLLNFGLIKDCIDYVEARYPHSAHFNMTINGTLLNEERMKYLAEKNFSLLVSIDGPREIHDRYRVFRNGRGSFACVFRNLRTFKSRYPDYYMKKVRFNMVLAPPFDFEALNDFISDSEIKPAGINFSNVDRHFTTFFDQFCPEDKRSFKQGKIDNLDSFTAKLARGEELNEVEKNMFKTRFFYIHKREMKKLPERYPSHGQCMIGTRSLLINTDGSFNFCTRIDDVYNLGDIYAGFDYQSIEKLYFDLDRFLGERCYGCWAIRFCLKCLKDLNKNGELSDEVFEELCRKKRRAILEEIKDYIRIRESSEHALDYLDQVTLS